jgi:hypothetical protein
MKRRTVIGEQPADAYTQAGVPRYSIAQKLHGAGLLHVWMHRREAIRTWLSPATNRYSQPAPAIVSLPIAGDTMAGACDATQLLGIDVQQIARRSMPVSLNRLPRW